MGRSLPAAFTGFMTACAVLFGVLLLRPATPLTPADVAAPGPALPAPAEPEIRTHDFSLAPNDRPQNSLVRPASYSPGAGPQTIQWLQLRIGSSVTSIEDKKDIRILTSESTLPFILIADGDPGTNVTAIHSSDSGTTIALPAHPTITNAVTAALVPGNYEVKKGADSQFKISVLQLGPQGEGLTNPKDLLSTVRLGGTIFDSAISSPVNFSSAKQSESLYSLNFQGDFHVLATQSSGQFTLTPLTQFVLTPVSGAAKTLESTVRLSTRVSANELSGQVVTSGGYLLQLQSDDQPNATHVPLLPVNITPDPADLGQPPRIVRIQQPISDSGENQTPAVISSFLELEQEPKHRRLEGNSADLLISGQPQTSCVLRGAALSAPADANGVFSLPAPDAASQDAELLTSIRLEGDTDNHTIQVFNRWTGESGPSVSLITPGVFAPPLIVGIRADGGAMTLANSETPHEVKGDSIDLTGRAGDAERLELWVFEQSDSDPKYFQLQPDKGATIGKAPFSGGRWTHSYASDSLKIDRKYRLHVVGFRGEQHRFSAPLEVVRKLNSIGIASVGTISVQYNLQVGAKPRNALAENTIGATTAALTMKNIEGTAQGDVVKVLSGTNVLAEATVSSPNSDIIMTVTDLEEGKNELSAVIYRAGRAGNAREFSVNVITSGPQITSVQPDPFGQTPGQQVLGITFSSAFPLDEASVQNKANYVLIRRSGQGGKVTVEEARFDRNTNTVFLTFAETGGVSTITADTYKLFVNGHSESPSSLFSELSNDQAPTGIRDQLGNLLAGNSRRGTDYEQLLDGRTQQAKPETVAASAGPAAVPAVAERVGLPETTGSPVDYPEFTERREFLNGFNPSDKVVTRVARLYYYRDAHRVTQIINRRAQSYNRQGATMARQLADKARIFAESTVDRRRAAERAAEEAAGAARQAENTITRLQQQFQAADRDVQRYEQEKAALESLIAQRKTEAELKDITPETAADGTPTPLTDTQQAQQQRIEELRSAANAELPGLQGQLAALDQTLVQSRANASLFSQETSAAIAALDALRERELEQRRTMESEQAKEDRAVADQFRLEVRAADEDPDTYAAGDPSSNDPVAQVTLSVIGEGLIQMRGPRKGVNIVHTMINQIDAPVGQVRIGVHTVQVNGEDGRRMEQVVSHISRYIDHARFLTSQSAQMLRNAVAAVAARKAVQVGLTCDPVTGALLPSAPLIGETGVVVDAEGRVISGTTAVSPTERYQEAFFGREFMRQLRLMDSEFVRDGNLLLSLHSMDSTSLSSALFLIALAGNETRMEILHEFESQCQCKLPSDELEYYTASDASTPFGFRKFELMADRARFVSLRGYFDANITGNNTLNPVQREFLKLAQILKSRLVTEIELKQRIVERALIEERLGDYRQQLVDARNREATEARSLSLASDQLQEQLKVILTQTDKVSAAYAAIQRRETSQIRSQLTSRIQPVLESMQVNPNCIDMQKATRLGVTRFITQRIEQVKKDCIATLLSDEFEADEKRKWFVQLVANTTRTITDLAVSRDLLQDKAQGSRNSIQVEVGSKKLDISFDANLKEEALVTGDGRQAVNDLAVAWSSEILASHLLSGLPEADQLRIMSMLDKSVAASKQPDVRILDALFGFVAAIDEIRRENVRQIAGQQSEAAGDLRFISQAIMNAGRAVAGEKPEASGEFLRDALARWHARSWKNSDDQAIAAASAELDTAFDKLLQSDLEVTFAMAAAANARRPLDHKKFLDMFIDDAEEKYIELVEGTRAHTAVIDDYVKRICTALEDDFNTQFYEPAFRKIRESTYSCRQVALGQIEHTSVLTNNREFGKVSPQATMEFDLPRRRIAVSEAMAAAQAAYDDYGALLGDPNFLALTKLNAGQPTAALFGNTADGSAVRSVLPGLPSDTGESAVIQAKTGQPEFQSQLEALIPDPAIYKFETGTAYEVRPVIQPDGQSVVFDFDYMYTTNVREPVRADEKHLGRVKRHFINTDVQISNYELREISRYRVALKASRSGRGVPLLEDIPLAGALFRPPVSADSSLQQNVILGQSVIYPTMFDLMGLRWAPAVADITTEDLKLQEFTYRNRMRLLQNEAYDVSASQVDEFMRIEPGERRPDLYRPQRPIRYEHPNGYIGPGLNIEEGTLQEGSPLSLPPAGEIPPNSVPLRRIGDAQPSAFNTPDDSFRGTSPLAGAEQEGAAGIVFIEELSGTGQPSSRHVVPASAQSSSERIHTNDRASAVVPAAHRNNQTPAVEKPTPVRRTHGARRRKETSGWKLRLPF